MRRRKREAAFWVTLNVSPPFVLTCSPVPDSRYAAADRNLLTSAEFTTTFGMLAVVTLPCPARSLCSFAMDWLAGC